VLTQENITDQASSTTEKVSVVPICTFYAAFALSSRKNIRPQDHTQCLNDRFSIAQKSNGQPK